MKDFFSKLRAYFILDPLIWLYTVVLGAVSLLCSLFDGEGRMQHGLARLWSRMILATALSPVALDGLQNLPAGAAVYAVNHTSALDIPVLYANLPRQFRILAKQELFRYPFMGWHLKRSGQIPVAQEVAGPGRGLSMGKAASQAVATLRAGMPLLVFPEGGRSTDGHLQTFLGGAFYAAIRTGVPVVPMVIVGAFDVLRMNSFHIRPGAIQFAIGEPISPAGHTPRDLEAFTALVRRVMEEMYYARAKIARPEAAAQHEGT